MNLNFDIQQTKLIVTNELLEKNLKQVLQGAYLMYVKTLKKFNEVRGSLKYFSRVSQ
jgi:hypothetical protein